MIKHYQHPHAACILLLRLTLTSRGLWCALHPKVGVPRCRSAAQHSTAQHSTASSQPAVCARRKRGHWMRVAVWIRAAGWTGEPARAQSAALRVDVGHKAGACVGHSRTHCKGYRDVRAAPASHALVAVEYSPCWVAEGKFSGAEVLDSEVARTDEHIRCSPRSAPTARQPAEGTEGHWLQRASAR